MAFLDPVTLTGDLVHLEPLSAAHADGLRAATLDGRVWELWYTSAPSPDGVDADIAAKMDLVERRLMMPLVIRRRADDRVIGVSTYCNPLPAVPAVEIGYTWNAASARRTGTNTEAKLLMLRHAFSTWGVRRVAFRTNWFNLQSRTAIERLGAVFEGRIRSDRISREGIVGDTAQYSLTAEQWPSVEMHLNLRLARRGHIPPGV